MENEFKQNIKTFLSSANLVYDNKDYTSATMLYFKTLFVTLDLAIFQKLKKTPKDHTDRFRILEKDFPEEYKLLDRYFSVYRPTYSTTIEKETCDEVKSYVKKTLVKFIEI